MQETWRFANKNCTVLSYYFSKRTDLCFPLPQRFEKTFAL